MKNLQELVSEREVREGLEELPDVPKKGVIMRFRPAPSGPITCGTYYIKYDFFFVC